MGKFRHILTELSARDTPIFSFLVDNLSNCQGILTKLNTCIDINIKEVWFGIANEQILSVFDIVIYTGHDNGGDYRCTFLLYQINYHSTLYGLTLNLPITTIVVYFVICF